MLKFIKSQPVLFAAFSAALITMFIIPPDIEYKDYINKTVLIQLFALMAAVAGFRSVGIFEKATNFMLEKTGTVRKLGLVFTLLCYFSSMLVTNDVALLTFVPLTIIVFSNINDEKSRILTIVLETAAANLGSMLTPVGNPQNLYLYDKYMLTSSQFVKTMLPAGLISLVMLILLTFLLPNTKCRLPESNSDKIDTTRTIVYSVLFVICLLTVFRLIPDYICLAISVIVMFLCDKKLFSKVDYTLLATFVCFFVFVGNIARIESVRSFFSDILSGHEIIVSAVLSQVISNVPAAVMLSGFTENGTSLLLGVNLGGLGTIIASLASLISFQFYRKSENAHPGKYMFVFSVVNFGMLIILMLIHLFI